MATIVIAPDSFKSSVSALEVATALAEGWRDVRPGDELRLIPQADGGEGTAEAIAPRSTGSWQTTTVTGPDGAQRTARWFLLDPQRAVADCAEAAGIALMPELDPLGATSRGVGELIAAIAARGVTQLQLGLGGTACTDGGAGALAGLGYRLIDRTGDPISDGGAGLLNLDRIEAGPPKSLELILITDVTAPLLGDEGAAAVFGPQKGADARQVELLERGLTRWAELLGGNPGVAGFGAAGGLGFGLTHAASTRIVDGAAWVAQSTGLLDALEDADLLITGEGSFDRTSLLGKVVGHAIHTAAKAGVGVQVVAGQVEASMRPVASAGGSGPVALTELSGTLESAIAEPQHWLRECGGLLAQRYDSRLRDS